MAAPLAPRRRSTRAPHGRRDERAQRRAPTARSSGTMRRNRTAPGSGDRRRAGDVAAALEAVEDAAAEIAPRLVQARASLQPHRRDVRAGRRSAGRRRSSGNTPPRSKWSARRAPASDAAAPAGSALAANVSSLRRVDASSVPRGDEHARAAQQPAPTPDRPRRAGRSGPATRAGRRPAASAHRPPTAAPSAGRCRRAAIGAGRRWSRCGRRPRTRPAPTSAGSGSWAAARRARCSPLSISQPAESRDAGDARQPGRRGGAR